MAAIAQPLNLSGYRPFPVDTTQNKIGDAVASAIEALKGSSGVGGLPVQPYPLDRKPFPLEQFPGAAPGVRSWTPPTDSIAGQVAGAFHASPLPIEPTPSLSPEWAARGITPPQAPAERNPYNQVGNLLGEIRQLGPDWKTELAKKYGNRLGGR